MRHLIRIMVSWHCSPVGACGTVQIVYNATVVGSPFKQYRAETLWMLRALSLSDVHEGAF